MRAPITNIVALGGGTGLPLLLHGLRAALFARQRWPEPRDRNRLSAIVTVADDGGSSGRLRREYRVLPPGDIRNCLLALSDGDPALSEIFNFRFNGTGEMSGHSLGNLILTALSQMEHDFPKAIERAGEMLMARGRVFPSTPDDVTLRVEFADGSSIEGESRIAAARNAIRTVSLHPKGARALPAALDAIAAADLIVIAPGSLYTSVIPVLLVPGIADAIAASSAQVVAIMNLMTEPGETDRHRASDSLAAIRQHAPRVPIHSVLVNTAPIPQPLLHRYAADQAFPLTVDLAALENFACRVIAGDLIGGGPKIRHDPRKLARAVLEAATDVTAVCVPPHDAQRSAAAAVQVV